MAKLWNKLDSQAAELWSAPRTPEIRAKLIVHYLPFAELMAAKRARSHRHANVEFDDVQSEACLGLIRAIDSYDPRNERKASFTTYAAPRLYGAAIEAERSNDICGPKARAHDRILRERLEAGEAINTWELAPSYRQSPAMEDGSDWADSQPCAEATEESPAVQLERSLEALDPVIARRLQDALDVMREHPAKSSHRDGRNYFVGPDVASHLAKRWGMTPIGAATVLRACRLHVQDQIIAA